MLRKQILNQKWAQRSEMIFDEPPFSAPGTARNFKAFTFSRGGEFVCGGNCCGGIPLSGANRPWTVGSSLWRCRECHGIGLCFRQYSGRSAGIKRSDAGVIWRHCASRRVSDPCGAAFLLPLSSFWRYGILLGMFAVCQLGASLFSTYAISLIQERTPEKLMGKIMSYVFTISMCAQPAGQIIYGALFDRFSDRVFWVLIPSGLIVTGSSVMASARFFRSLSAVKYDKDNNGVLLSAQPFKVKTLRYILGNLMFLQQT